MNQLTKKEKFILFVLGIGMASFFFITFIWNANSYYTDAYRQPINDSRVLHEKLDRVAPVSKQPARRGVSEDDIDKHTGHRYATF